MGNRSCTKIGYNCRIYVQGKLFESVLHNMLNGLLAFERALHDISRDTTHEASIERARPLAEETYAELEQWLERAEKTSAPWTDEQDNQMVPFFVCFGLTELNVRVEGGAFTRDQILAAYDQLSLYFTRFVSGLDFTAKNHISAAMAAVECLFRFVFYARTPEESAALPVYARCSENFSKDQLHAFMRQAEEDRAASSN